jgi:hypothetical protein
MVLLLSPHQKYPRYLMLASTPSGQVCLELTGKNSTRRVVLKSTQSKRDELVKIPERTFEDSGASFTPITPKNASRTIPVPQ